MLNEIEVCTFYVIRHGETQLNAIGRRQGRQDYPLTQEAVSKAHELGKSLEKVKFDAFFCSTLLRSITTANIIQHYHPDTEVIHDDRLLERYFGKYEVPGHSSEFNRKIDILSSLDPIERFYHKIEAEIESDFELATRMSQFFKERTELGKTFGVIGHAGAIRAFLLQEKFATWNELAPGAIANLGYFVLETDGVGMRVGRTSGIKKMS